jgi:hypothetical protein
MVVVFGLGSGSCLVHFLCSNMFLQGIDNYTHHKVLDLSGYIVFIVLLDIAQAALLQHQVGQVTSLWWC